MIDLIANENTGTLYMTGQEFGQKIPHIKRCVGGMKLPNGNQLFLIKLLNGDVTYVQVTETTPND